MNNSKVVSWILRITIAGEFFGHAMFALQGKQQWIGWIEKLLHVDAATAVTLLTVVGVADILVAIIVLIRPIHIVLAWAVIWGFWTAILRPIVGESWWDFIERWANWGAPLALLVTIGWPKSIKQWFR